MLVLGYVRVSSTEQEQGYGFEVQEEAIRSYCQRKGLDTPEIIRESESAEGLVDRIEIRQVIARARSAQDAGTPSHIVFHKLDRLARDLMGQEMVVELAMRKGFRLYSTSSAEEQTLDPAFIGDPSRVMIRQIFGSYNQFERSTIQGRLDSGLAIKARDNGSTGGRMPFGYQALRGDIAIDPETAPAVVRAFQMQACGLDLNSIVAVLGREFPTHCGHWTKTMLHRVLKRVDLYCRGMYRTRLGIEAKHRPELVIIHDRFQQAVPRPLSGPLDWSRVPDPVPILTLILLTGLSKDTLQAGASQWSVPVRWLKGRMIFGREHAQALVSKLMP